VPRQGKSLTLEHEACHRSSRPFRGSYAAFFLAARNAAQRAFCAAAIFLRADADILRFGFGACLLAFDHRAFCAKLIRLRADADMMRPGFAEVLPPFILPRTTRTASTRLSSSAKLVLAARNFDTNSARPTKSAMSTPTRILMRDDCIGGE
jgi:hypothetical protein